jgi:hypothetical protein
MLEAVQLALILPSFKAALLILNREFELEGQT